MKGGEISMEEGDFPRRLPITSEVSFISSVTVVKYRHPDWFPEEGVGAAASGKQSMVLMLTDDNPSDVFLIVIFSFISHKEVEKSWFMVWGPSSDHERGFELLILL
jgi:hypothetical protein